MSKPYFFGYGSLVNRATHIYTAAHPARLQGWRRVWRHTARFSQPILTVEPCAGSLIEGLIAHVPGGDWAALDQREIAYDRVPVTKDVHHQLADAAQRTVQTPAQTTVDIATYYVPETKHPAPAAPLPILLSYLDVVVQGYLREFDEAGVAAFFDTTHGWHAPVRNDRAAPIYPRHQSLSSAEQDLVDHHLHRVGGKYVD